MVLSEEEANARLSSPDNLINKLKNSRAQNPNISIQPIQGPGRTAGTKNIPDSVRNLIGSLANTSSSTQAEIADTFDVSQFTVSTASRGLVSHRYDPRLRREVEKEKKERQDLLEEKSSSIHEQALDNLVSTMQALQGKIPIVAKAKDLAVVASHLSRVATNMDIANRKSDKGNVQNVQVILHAPHQIPETNYDTVEA